MTWMIGTLAALTSLAGVGSLLASWRLRAPKPAGLKPLGWALLVGALGLWLLAQPAEFAVVFALVVPALWAWLLIGWRASKHSLSRDTKLEQRGFEWPALSVLCRQLLKLLVCLPLAGLATALVSFTLTHWLPWEPVNQLVTGVLLMPVLWGAASYWSLADPRLWRPALTFTLLGAAAAAALFL